MSKWMIFIELLNNREKIGEVIDWIIKKFKGGK